MESVTSLRKALNVLKKSSPQAVEVECPDRSRDVLKKYLYIETDIEKDFVASLESLAKKQIIFLCGSSGDGKSAILTRYSSEYAHKAFFHLDATHSSAPHQDAITTLDQLFTEAKKTSSPLVIGINIGMMANYAEGGSDEHDAIKRSMRAHLNEGPTPLDHIYIDFEKYPKFVFGETGPFSEFAIALMKRITSNENNPFWDLLEQDKHSQNDPRLTVNFSLLALDSVQKIIVETLLKSRLVKDQFVTARTLLDFMHQLLTDEGYLFDNLFSGSDNELLQQIKLFDPSTLRTKRIDHFILQFSLELVDGNFDKFKEDLNAIGIFGIDSPTSFIRLFYLLRDQSIGNNFHHSFSEDFSDELINSYAKFWKLHTNFSDSNEERTILRTDFYNNILLQAIHNYMNRNAMKLRRRQYFIGEYNGYQLAAPLDIKADFEAILNDCNDKIGYFNAYLKVSNNSLPPLSVNINLLELMIKLTQGYRPNKHDKNTIVILDEIVEAIVELANNSQSLIIVGDSVHYEVTQSDNIIEVSGV